MAAIRDLVLIYQEESPASFARIEDIWADKKRDWYNVKLLLLQIPVSEVVWILRETYLNGEAFTMNGVKMRLEKVVGPSRFQKQSASTEGDSGKDAKGRQGKVISLFGGKKD